MERGDSGPVARWLHLHDVMLPPYPPPAKVRRVLGLLAGWYSNSTECPGRALFASISLTEYNQWHRSHSDAPLSSKGSKQHYWLYANQWERLIYHGNPEHILHVKCWVTHGNIANSGSLSTVQWCCENGAWTLFWHGWIYLWNLKPVLYSSVNINKASIYCK